MTRYPQKPPTGRGTNNEEIRLLGSVEDTLVRVSDIFTDPKLTYVNLAVENKTLLAASISSRGSRNRCISPTTCSTLLVHSRRGQGRQRQRKSPCELFRGLQHPPRRVQRQIADASRPAIRHSRVADSVWVLASGHVPFLVQAAKGDCGIEGRFRLVGESFVHGTMEGDAVAKGCTGHAWGIALWFNCIDRVRIGSSSRRKHTWFRSLAILPDVGR
jgi:hypothetical protein